MRLLPIALAAWVATWLTTSGQSVHLMIGLGLLLSCFAAALLRRSWWTGATALMLAGGMAVGMIHQHALDESALTRLASQRAVGSIQVVTTSEATVHPSTGPRPPYAVLTATATEVTGRGHSWTEHTPVLITVSGDNVGQWNALPVGSTVQGTMRIETAQPGSDVAGVLRATAPPRRVSPPSGGMRVINRVYAGLRDAVHAGKPRQRAFIPAMVLGDTAGISPTMDSNFKITALTHLLVVSGMNLTGPSENWCKRGFR